ncbi:MAG: pyridoxal-phosphate-dependent aminotransferase family protein [Methanomassiliicoccales archaeon]
MSRQMITHRSQEYKRLHEGVVEKLHRVLETDMHIILAACSSTGFLESCVRCGVHHRMVGASNGAFGERWQRIVQANGKEVDRVEAPWGSPVRPEQVARAVTPETEAVALVSNESSTGVFNPIKELVDAAREEHDPLVFVDGVTSVGGMDLDIDSLDLDALVFGSQKALALPPGLAVICVSDRLLAKAEEVDARGYYFDLVELKRYADRGFALTTPPVSLLYGLDFQLDRMLEEGMPTRYDRHRRMAEMVRGWADPFPGLFAEAGCRSNTITVVNDPEGDFERIQEGLGRRGIEISPGYGKLKDSTFRIGHMGDLTVEDVGHLLDSLEEVMEASS